VAARYGGEGILDPSSRNNSDEASVIAERIRHRVEQTAFPNVK
jgi:PleD family two-component response regulator